jgi:hypothetical protein
MSELRFPGVKCIAEGPRSILVLIGDEKKWIPQALIHADSEVWKRGQEGTLVLPEWFVIERGLDQYYME